MTDDWTQFDRGPEGGRSLAEVEAGLRMPLERVMLGQRAVRKVLPDAVDDGIILRCIDLALRAPTGSNGQNCLCSMCSRSFNPVRPRFRSSHPPERSRKGSPPG